MVDSMISETSETPVPTPMPPLLDPLEASARKYNVPVLDKPNTTQAVMETVMGRRQKVLVLSPTLRGSRSLFEDCVKAAGRSVSLSGCGIGSCFIKVGESTITFSTVGSGEQIRAYAPDVLIVEDAGIIPGHVLGEFVGVLKVRGTECRFV